jgi:hypothetical protein
MTTSSQLSAIIEWAGNKGIDFTADFLDTPPAFLDLRLLLTSAEQASYGSGICVTLKTQPEAEYPGQIGWWITPSGKKGTWCSMAEDEGEISTEWLADFDTEEQLISLLDAQAEEFLNLGNE